MTHLTAVRERWPRLAVACLCLGSVACGAPESEPATGAVAEDVKASIAGGSDSFDHDLWDALLADAVVDGRADYALFSQRRDELQAYLGTLAAVSLDRLSGDELKALLINTYNALTVESILAHPGISSIKDISGVWDKTRHTVGGHDLTLDEIEHNLLRPFFRDPRIHFVVNCASASCAPLPPWAFTGTDLEAQIDERTRAFVNDPRNVSLDGRDLVLSQYFNWYGSDFTASGWQPRAETIPEFVARYAAEDVASAILADADISVRFADYDWSLNDASGAGS